MLESSCLSRADNKSSTQHIPVEEDNSFIFHWHNEPPKIPYDAVTTMKDRTSWSHVELDAVELEMGHTPRRDNCEIVASNGRSEDALEKQDQTRHRVSTKQKPQTNNMIEQQKVKDQKFIVEVCRGTKFAQEKELEFFRHHGQSPSSHHQGYELANIGSMFDGLGIMDHAEKVVYASEIELDIE